MCGDHHRRLLPKLRGSNSGRVALANCPPLTCLPSNQSLALLFRQQQEPHPPPPPPPSLRQHCSSILNAQLKRRRRRLCSTSSCVVSQFLKVSLAVELATTFSRAQKNSKSSSIAHTETHTATTRHLPPTAATATAAVDLIDL